jgi:tetratricopeptide (TPR) repeat protein
VERIPVDKSAPTPQDNAGAPPRSDGASANESSSKQTQIDISPPVNDDKLHPHSAEADDTIDEFHPWDPHKAAKDIEVGDYYFKKENYRAAVSRYQEALQWKPNDAEATFKLAEAMQKAGDLAGAVENYRAYLKIFPTGPMAKRAHEAIGKLKDKVGASSAQTSPKPN